MGKVEDAFKALSKANSGNIVALKMAYDAAVLEAQTKPKLEIAHSSTVRDTSFKPDQYTGKSRYAPDWGDYIYDPTEQPEKPEKNQAFGVEAWDKKTAELVHIREVQRQKIELLMNRIKNILGADKFAAITEYRLQARLYNNLVGFECMDVKKSF